MNKKCTGSVSTRKRKSEDRSMNSDCINTVEEWIFTLPDKATIKKLKNVLMCLENRSSFVYFEYPYKFIKKNVKDKHVKQKC